MSDMTVDSDDEAKAQLRRALIRVANTKWRFDAFMIMSLLTFALNTLTVSVLEHPSFPNGAVYAWAAHNKVDLGNYENKELPRKS